MSIRPGLDVKVIVETDQRIEGVNPRNSQIYDIDGDSVILAQTEPSIKSSMLNQEIVVTYLVKGKHSYSRYGFLAVIAEFIDRYQLISKQHVPAIAVHKRTDPKPYNIRLSCRVEPSSKSGLDVSIYDKKVNVIDISIGGMRFSYHKGLQLETNSVIEVRLGMAGAVYTIEARIIRTWEAEVERFGKDLCLAAVEFVNVSARIEQALSHTIRDIERETLAITRRFF